MKTYYLLAPLLCLAACTIAPTLALTEEERLVQYHARNYTWPITKYTPDTPGWNKLMAHRIRQVEEIEDRSSRFEAFAQVLSSGILQSNYTEYGFGLARAPDDLMEVLRQGIKDGLAAGPRLEGDIAAITGEQPWFIDRPDLTKRVMNELHHYPETWAGVELTPYTAYGFRLYRNQSSLYVHIDKAETHVISFILHIDKSDDAEDWPILIEDFHGRTHEIILTSGDIIFYESSKCFHGRPRKFNGSWYSSLFVHYYPKYGYKESYDRQDKVYAIPPAWTETPTMPHEIPIEMHGTTMEEPMCPNGWCGTEHSHKWSGPGEEGYWIAPTGEKFPFDPKVGPKMKQPKCIDKHQKCAFWAGMEPSECQSNPTYMHLFCPMSCKECTPDRDEL